MKQSSVNSESIRRHTEYLYEIPLEDLEKLKARVTTGAYSKMLLYVYLDRTLPEKESRAQIKV